MVSKGPSTLSFHAPSSFLLLLIYYREMLIIFGTGQIHNFFKFQRNFKNKRVYVSQCGAGPNLDIAREEKNLMM